MLVELEVLDFDDVCKMFMVKGSFEVLDMGFVNDDYMYFLFIIYSFFVKNFFVCEKWDYFIDFLYLFEEKLVYSYIFLVGYVVEFLLENVNFILLNFDVMFQYMVCE